MKSRRNGTKKNRELHFMLYWSKREKKKKIAFVTVSKKGCGVKPAFLFVMLVFTFLCVLFRFCGDNRLSALLA